MKKFAALFTGSLLASLTLLFCGTVFSRTTSPFGTTNQVHDELQAIRCLKSNFPETGTYVIPGPQDDNDMIKELHETGPTALVHLVNQEDIVSTFAKESQIFLEGFWGFMIIGSLLLSFGPKTGQLSRFSFVLLIGLAAVIHCDLAGRTWAEQPWRWNFVSALYDFFTWAVAGLVLTLVVRPSANKQALRAHP
jgi:hypothetical protein